MRLFVYHFSFFSTYNTYILLYSKSGDNMRKRFKSKRKIKIKGIITLFFLMLLIYLFITYFKNIQIVNSNKNFINNIF